MSKLYINDLESIKNGKLVKLNLGYQDYGDEIKLSKLSNQIKDLRQIRHFILDTFKNEVRDEFERAKGDRIEVIRDVQFDSRNPFLSKFMFLKVPTMFGDTNCLVSKDGLESATFKSSEIYEKIELILPYVRGILNVKNRTNVLTEDFYNGIALYNYYDEKVLNVNGDGILLPFNSYDDLNEDELQELLRYYYSNYDEIIKNISIPDVPILNCFRTNASKQKTLALYEEGKYKK